MDVVHAVPAGPGHRETMMTLLVLKSFTYKADCDKAHDGCKQGSEGITDDAINSGTGKASRSLVS